MCCGEGLSSVGWRVRGVGFLWCVWVPCAQLAPVCLTVCSFHPAMQQVLDNLGSLPNATGAAELDLIFLRGIMESPIVRSLAKVVCSREVDTRVLCLGRHSRGWDVSHREPWEWDRWHSRPWEGGMHGHPCPGDQSEPLQVVGAHLHS